MRRLLPQHRRRGKAVVEAFLSRRRFFTGTPVRYVQPLPPVAPAVDTNSPGYAAAAQEALLLSRQDFAQRLHAFSRHNFDRRQVPAVHALLTELAARRIIQQSGKTVHEYMQLAYVAGLHELCLALYHARRQQEAQLAVPTPDKSTDRSSSHSDAGLEPLPATFFATSHVIDSAYALQNLGELSRMASHCARRVEGALRIGESPRTVQFSLLRALWRTVCLAVRWAALERNGTHTVHGSCAHAFATAEKMVRESVAVLCPAMAGEAAAAAFVRQVRRLVQYDSSGDDGEMLFFRRCLDDHILHVPSPPTAPSPASDAAPLAGSGGFDTIPDVELFYAALVDSCAAGVHVGAALNYFDIARQHVGLPSFLTPPISDTSPAVLPLPNSTTGVAEYLLFRLLTVLQQARDNKHIVALARMLLRDGADIGISVWSSFLISAGEMRASDVAIAAYDGAMYQLVDVTDRPSVAERRGWEYLLQTALSALSKCQVRDFEARLLRPAYDAGLLHCTEEFYMCCLLQDAHSAVRPQERAEEIVAAMREKGMPLTEAIVTRLLRLYLRIESPIFLATYREAVEGCGLFRRAWLEELIVWAERCRHQLSHSNRCYILGEVQRVMGEGGRSGGSAALRGLCAQLQFDCAEKPSEHYTRPQQHPPPTAPTSLDLRMRFILKRPVEVLRGMPVEMPAVVGDPRRQGDLCEVCLLAETPLLTAPLTCGDTHEGPPPPLQEAAALLYMGQMLEGLQRSLNYA